jgi:hypothetical protein
MGGVQPVVRLALNMAVSARRALAEELAALSHSDRDFAATLLEVKESGIFTVPELARLVGLSRSKTYELIADAERERDR